jgi:hypothetical protein
MSGCHTNINRTIRLPESTRVKLAQSRRGVRNSTYCTTARNSCNALNSRLHNNLTRRWSVMTQPTLLRTKWFVEKSIWKKHFPLTDFIKLNLAEGKKEEFHVLSTRCQNFPYVQKTSTNFTAFYFINCTETLRLSFKVVFKYSCLKPKRLTLQVIYFIYEFPSVLQSSSDSTKLQSVANVDDHSGHRIQPSAAQLKWN